MFRSLMAALVVALFASPALADRSSCTPFVAVFNPTEAKATDDFFNFYDRTFSATEANEDDFWVSEDTEIRSLSAWVNVAPGAGDQWDVTVRSGAANTALSCAIAGTATTCADSDSATIGAGADMTLLVTSNNGATDPAVAATVSVTFCVGSKE